MLVGDTTASFASGTHVTVGAYVTILAESTNTTETVLVTSLVSGTTYDVTRAQLGTAASAHSNGATVNLPGAIVFDLLANTVVPNQTVWAHKTSSDINFVDIVAGGSNFFPGGVTHLLLIDNSALYGQTIIKFPAIGNQLIVAGGVGSGAGSGAPGPPGPPGTNTPPAPNILGATCTVTYPVNGNATNRVQFAGNITLPVSDPNYSHFYEIDIVGVDPSGNGYLLLSLTKPSGGWGSSPLAYSVVSQILQPASTQSWTIYFYVFNESGNPTTSGAYSVSVTLTAIALSGFSCSELSAQKWADLSGALHDVIQASLTVTPSGESTNVTFWNGQTGTVTVSGGNTLTVTGGNLFIEPTQVGSQILVGSVLTTIATWISSSQVTTTATGLTNTSGVSVVIFQWLGWNLVSGSQTITFGARESSISNLFAPAGTGNQTWKLYSQPGAIDGQQPVPISTATVTSTFTASIGSITSLSATETSKWLDQSGAVHEVITAAIGTNYLGNVTLWNGQTGTATVSGTTVTVTGGNLYVEATQVGSQVLVGSVLTTIASWTSPTQFTTAAAGTSGSGVAVTIFQWLGWWLSTPTSTSVIIGQQSGNNSSLFAPIGGNQTWKLYGQLGTIDGAQPVPVLTAFISSGFTATAPPAPGSTVASDAYIDAITYTTTSGVATTWRWNNMYCTVTPTPTTETLQFVVQTGHYNSSGTFVPGGAFPQSPAANNGAVIGQFSNYSGGQLTPPPGQTSITVNNNNPTGTGTLAIALPTDGNLIWRVYAFIGSALNGGTWTQQNTWSSGVGVSTPGTNPYQEIVLDGTKASVLLSGLSVGGSQGMVLGVLTVNGNAFLNPGFENSHTTITPWFGTGGVVLKTDGNGHGSSQNYVAVPVSTGDILYQEVSGAAPGQQFIASVWIRNDSGVTRFDIQLNAFNSSGSYVGTPADTVVTSGFPGATWKQYSVNGTMPANTAFVSLNITSLTSGSGTGNIYVDDASITLLSSGGGMVTTSYPNSAAGLNNGNLAQSVIPDPGFEYEGPTGTLLPMAGGVGPWIGDGIGAFISTPGDNSNYCLELNGAGSGIGAYAMQTVPVVPGQPYYISAYVLNNGVTAGGTLAMSVNIVWFTSSGSIITTNSFTVSGSITSTWQLALNGFVTAPSTAANARIQLITSSASASGMTWFVDNVNLQPVINQPANGQNQSTYPVAQTSGYSALSSSSTTTSATATYGLMYAQIVNSNGAMVQMRNDSGGTYEFLAQYNSGNFAQLYTGPSASGMLVIDSGTGALSGVQSNTGFICKGSNGFTGTINYAKAGGGSGTITVTGGIITNVT